MPDAGEFLLYTATSAKLISIIKNLILDPLFKPKKYFQNYPRTTVDFENRSIVIEVNLDIIEPGGKLSKPIGYTIPYPDYGIIESIQVFDLLVNNPIGFTRVEKPKKSKLILYINEPKGVQQVKIIMKITVNDKKFFRDLVQKKIIRRRDSYLAFLAEVELENMSDTFIRNYRVEVPVPRIDLRFPELALISERQKRVKDKQKEERFRKEVKKRFEKFRFEEFIKLLEHVLSDQKKPSWNVKRNDPNHPEPKRTIFHQEDYLFAGSVVFYVDIKPREAISYQILGPDLSKIIQQDIQKEGKKK